MAKDIGVPNLGMFTYLLDECEDYLVLDAYLHISDSHKFNNARHVKIFEFYHLQEGGSLNDNILLQLNGYLRQLGRPSLMFVNGHTTNYAGLRGQDKVLRRQAILDHLHSLPTRRREELIAKKEAEATRLPERNPDFAARPPTLPVGGLSRTEIEKRRAALAEAQRTDAARSIRSSVGQALALPPARTIADDRDNEFVPKSTVQDNVVELISEMSGLRAEVGSLKSMLQNIFRSV